MGGEFADGQSSQPPPSPAIRILVSVVVDGNVVVRLVAVEPEKVRELVSHQRPASTGRGMTLEQLAAGDLRSMPGASGGVLALDRRAALEADAREQALGRGVANMPATPLRLWRRRRLPSALLTDGPRGDGHVAAEGDEPACEGADGGGVVERMKTKSVISTPIWPPKPPPTVAMAEGADQVPSGRRAMMRPRAERAEPRKPALMTVMMARPFAQVEDLWRDDLLGAELVVGVDKGGRDLGGLLARLRC